MAAQRNSRRLRTTAVVGLLTAAGLAGCSTSHPARPTAGPPPAPAVTVSTPAPAPPQPFCAVSNPGPLARAETAGAITHGAGEDLAPAAVAPDGSSYFALDGHGAGAMTDLVWVRDHGQQRQKVFSLAAPYAGYGVAGFDGRWLVFMADTSKDLSGAWDLYAWDSRAGGAPKKIASDPGTAPDSPVEWPRVAAGRVTWIQAQPDGTRQVHLLDLASGHDRVVHTGHVGASLFAGDLLVWTEAFQPDGPVSLAAASADTGAPATLPAALAAAHTTPAALASDGTTWAWASADFRTLYAWRPGLPAPVVVRATDENDSVDELGVSGDLVTWTGATATYAADLKSRSYTQITAQYGSSLVNGSAVAVYYPHGDPKSPDMTYDGYVLDTAALTGLPGCRS